MWECCGRWRPVENRAIGLFLSGWLGILVGASHLEICARDMMLAKPFRWVAGVTPAGYSLEEQSVKAIPSTEIK